MTLRNSKYVFSINLCCFVIFAVTASFSSNITDQFTISCFSDTNMSIPAAGNSIILPYSNTTLNQVKTPPQELQRGQVLLRRRFSANEYSLYVGLMNSKAYSRLSAFKPPENSTLQSLISLKIYLEKSTNPNTDIENVYFDGNLIYVENAARIFYYQKEWIELQMLDQLPCRLNITSNPAGAQVFINNKEIGYTPLYIGAVNEPTAIVRLELKGYFIIENFLDLPGDVQVERQYELKKKPVFEDGSDIDIHAYTAENTESVLELNQRIETLLARSKSITDDSAKAINEFEKNYPTLAPRDQFEKTEEYEQRKFEYEQNKFKEREELCSQFHEKILRVVDVIPQIEKYREEVKDREYTKYFDGSLLKLSTYNADSEYFPVTMSVDEKGFSFKFNGKLMIPRDDAKDFFNRGTSSGKVHLTYKNWHINVARLLQGPEQDNNISQDSLDTLIKAKTDTIRENYYVYFTEFKLRFRDADYELNGYCNCPSFIEKSPEFLNFLKELDNKRELERIAREAKGTLKLTSQPPSARVFIFDSLVGVTPYTTDLSPLSYAIKIDLSGYNKIDTTIVIEKDKLIQKNFILKHTQAYMDSIEHKHNQTIKVWRWVRRIGFGGMTAALAGWGYHQHTLANTRLQTYQKMKSGKAEDFDAVYNSYKKRINYRNISCAAAVLSGASFVVSIPF